MVPSNQPRPGLFQGRQEVDLGRLNHQFATGPKDRSYGDGIWCLPPIRVSKNGAYAATKREPRSDHPLICSTSLQERFLGKLNRQLVTGPKDRSYGRQCKWFMQPGSTPVSSRALRVCSITVTATMATTVNLGSSATDTCSPRRWETPPLSPRSQLK